MSLDKKYKNFWVPELLKAYYTNRNYVETDGPLKSRRYYKFTLTNTDSLQIECKLADISHPNSIQYLKFTIKILLSPFEWYVDHLHIPISLSRNQRPQAYNWYDYKVAWYNFIYVQPNTHSCFMKYSEWMKTTVITR